MVNLVKIFFLNCQFFNYILKEYIYEPRSKFVTYPQVVGYLVSPLSFYRVLNIWGAKIRHNPKKCFYMQAIPSGTIFRGHAYICPTFSKVSKF